MPRTSILAAAALAACARNGAPRLPPPADAPVLTAACEEVTVAVPLPAIPLRPPPAQYRVERSADGGHTWSTVAAIDPALRTVTLRHQPAQPLQFRVFA